jgi:hypothetical protein
VKVDNKAKVILTLEELNKLTLDWKKLLGISDWETNVILSRENKMPVKGAACCQYCFDRKTADVYILDSIDYEDFPKWPQDMEQSLVHELLHLRFAPWDKKCKKGLELSWMEQTVDALAKAFVIVKRQGGESPLT